MNDELSITHPQKNQQKYPVFFRCFCTHGLAKRIGNQPAPSGLSSSFSASKDVIDLSTSAASVVFGTYLGLGPVTFGTFKRVVSDRIDHKKWR